MAKKDPLSPAHQSRLSPRLVTALVLVVLAVVFIFQNNQPTAIRILVPVVIMPLWVALASMLVIGAVIGYIANRRRG